MSFDSLSWEMVRDLADLVLFVQLYRKSTLSSDSSYPCQRLPRARRINRLSLMRRLPSRWFSSSMETSSRIGLWTELIRSSSGGTSITFETRSCYLVLVNLLAMGLTAQS